MATRPLEPVVVVEEQSLQAAMGYRCSMEEHTGLGLMETPLPEEAR
jgi:hypothetical protein